MRKSWKRIKENGYVGSKPKWSGQTEDRRREQYRMARDVGFSSAGAYRVRDLINPNVLRDTLDGVRNKEWRTMSWSEEKWKKEKKKKEAEKL